MGKRKSKIYICKMLYQSEYPKSCCYRSTVTEYDGKWRLVETAICNSEKVLTEQRKCKFIGMGVDFEYDFSKGRSNG